MNTTELTYKNVARYVAEKMKIYENRFEFDLTKISILDAFSSVYLSCSIVDAIRKVKVIISALNKEVSLPSSVISFSDHIDPDDIIWGSVNRDPDTIELDKTAIFTKKTEDTEVQNMLQELILELGIDVDLEGINEHLPELIDNARIHTVEPFYLMRCHYSEEERYFDIIIGDIGLGIKATLVKNSTYSYLRDEYHMRAIAKAFEPTVSGKSNFRGTGLSETHDYFFNSNKNLLFLCSGDGYYLINHKDDETQIQSGNLMYNLTGVQMLLRFGCDK
jgi:hypothetical protein